MTQYQYKFVRVDLKGGLIRSASPVEDYQQIIHEHAEEGWRLFQIFAPPLSGYGIASFFELIFERPRENEDQIDGEATRRSDWER